MSTLIFCTLAIFKNRRLTMYNAEFSLNEIDQFEHNQRYPPSPVYGIEIPNAS